MDAAVWGNCANFQSYSSLIQACGVADGGEGVASEAACATFGASCSWDGAHCGTTAVAMLRSVFDAAADAPSVVAAIACNAANTTAACEAAGAPAGVDASLLAAVASGDFAQAASLAQAAAAAAAAAAANATQTGGTGALGRAGGGALAGGLALLAALALA
jgi:hypothetical protein